MSAEFCVFLKIKPGMEEAFLAASRENQTGARQEPGNLRFDIYRSKENPSHFAFSEAYDSEESISLHRETPHYLKWIESATPMMVEPRQRVPGSEIPGSYEKV
jgi:(4S)-4-hydroxy-5-phosphonooxypentane-2,3-dione isomerase